jgi:hypothetical protein
MKRLLAVFLLATGPFQAHAEEAASPALVKQLTMLLNERKADTFAAEYPGEPGRFAAVLYLPGSQVLAITAPYAAADHLRHRIASGQYRDVYADLSAAPDRRDRLFVEDLLANGLHPAREDQRPYDITWRDGVLRTDYDGNWKRQQLSREAYLMRFTQDEGEYAALLKVLIDALARRP